MNIFRLTASLAVSLSACLGSGPLHADEACVTSFRSTVQPILNTNCVSCHQDAAPADGLSLQRTAAPASLLGVRGLNAPFPLVTAGEPDKSYLLSKIMGTHLAVGGQGAQMPLGRTLDEDDIKAISTWISSCKG